MPHATKSSLGLQAFILCGPGEGLNPFNSNPKDFPKALIAIANRPMIWYPLEWCHRAAVSSITLITPPECSQALEAALSQNPYLTSLPTSPRTSILAPADLDLNTSNAEIFRLREVQDAIVGDYVVLPCDLVCEVSGRALWEMWTTLQPPLLDVGAEKVNQKGGMGIWYETRDENEDGVAVKKEETDLLATTDLPESLSSACAPGDASFLSRAREVALAMPTDTLNDQLQEQEHLRLRTQLMLRRGKVRMQVRTRDAHLYFMPGWSKEYVRRNDTFDSFGEDVVGWWAKARWQQGLDKKLGFNEALRPAKRRKSSTGPSTRVDDEGIDLSALSSTCISGLQPEDDRSGDVEPAYATRVPRDETEAQQDRPHKPVPLPPFLAYVHPSLFVPSDGNASQQQAGQKEKTAMKGSQQHTQAPNKRPTQLIRRVDTVKLLLSVSLYLARLPSILKSLDIPTPSSTHPFCHQQQIHPTSEPGSPSTISKETVLIDANCTLQPRITIRDSAIGVNCSVASGSRLHGCLLMDGVIIEERVVLSGCVIGRRCKVGTGSELRDCQLQDGYIVPEGTTAKGEVLAGFDEGAGLDGDIDDEGQELDMSVV